jgi:hypothetical protein
LEFDFGNVSFKKISSEEGIVENSGNRIVERLKTTRPLLDILNNI